MTTNKGNLPDDLIKSLTLEKNGMDKEARPGTVTQVKGLSSKSAESDSQIRGTGDSNKDPFINKTAKGATKLGVGVGVPDPTEAKRKLAIAGYLDGTESGREGEDNLAFQPQGVSETANPTVLRRTTASDQQRAANPGAYRAGGNTVEPGHESTHSLGSDLSRELGVANNNADRQGLVEANPLNDSEVFAVEDLPEAEEVDPEQTTKNRNELKDNRFSLFVGLCVLVAVVGIALGVTLSKKDNSTAAPTSAPSIAPSAMPSSAPTGTLDQFLLGLPNHTLASLEDFGSPQSKALFWLEEHPNITNIPNSKAIQLFALATFFYSFEGPNWNALIQERWLDYNKDECFWFSSNFGSFVDEEYVEWAHPDVRTSCNEQGDFLRLNVQDLQLAGLSPSVPREISLLTALESIDLSWNEVETPLSQLIPKEVFHMGSVAELLFYINPITGTIPSQLGLLANLTVIQFAGCALSGSIPSQVGVLKDLKNLGLWGAGLSGTLPTELGQMASQQYLELGGGSLFTGTIPSQLGLLKDMRYLDLSATPTLTGMLPSELSALERLGILMLAGSTGLSGTLPEEICFLSSSNCTYVHYREDASPCYLDFNCTEQLCGCACPCRSNLA